jgi:hypothetical protein
MANGFGGFSSYEDSIPAKDVAIDAEIDPGMSVLHAANDGGDGSGVPNRHNSTMPPVHANDNKLFTERLHSRDKSGVFEPSEHRGQGAAHQGEVQSAQAAKNEHHDAKGKVEKSGWGNKFGHGNIIPRSWIDCKVVKSLHEGQFRNESPNPRICSYPVSWT